jgi:hypothetical protein
MARLVQWAIWIEFDPNFLDLFRGLTQARSPHASEPNNTSFMLPTTPPLRSHQRLWFGALILQPHSRNIWQALALMLALRCVHMSRMKSGNEMQAR